MNTNEPEGPPSGPPPGGSGPQGGPPEAEGKAAPPPSGVRGWLKPDGSLDREALIPRLRDFIGLLVRFCRFELKAEIRVRRPDAPPDVENPEIIVNFHGRDTALLLQRGGQLLRAIEYLTLRCLHLEPRCYDRLRFDCNDSKAIRIEELKLAATTAAERVKRSGAPFRFNPMDARERRIIHLVLRDDASVRTTSEGEGLLRSVVIYPAPPGGASPAPAGEPSTSEAPRKPTLSTSPAALSLTRKTKPAGRRRRPPLKRRSV
ncbi:MAG: protein jag [Terriglobia bacterium]